MKKTWIIIAVATFLFGVVQSEALAKKHDLGKEKTVELERKDHQNDKVVICHNAEKKAEKAHTISISKNALDTHMKHGDALGACKGENEDDEDEDDDGEGENEKKHKKHHKKEHKKGKLLREHCKKLDKKQKNHWLGYDDGRTDETCDDECSDACQEKGKNFSYDIVQITDNSSNEGFVNINDYGEVVWQSNISTSTNDIFYYDGASTMQITNDDIYFTNNKPDINENGYIAFNSTTTTERGSRLNQVRFYDGAVIKTIPIPANDMSAPQINNKNQIVFEGWDADNPTLANFEIYLYDGVSARQISHNVCHDYRPKVNDNGEITWFSSTEPWTPPNQGCGIASWEIFLFNGNDITQITSNQLLDGHSSININTHMIWTSVSGIYHLQQGNGDIVQLSDKFDSSLDITSPNKIPQINDNGNMAWGYKNEIYFFDGIVATLVTDTVNEKRGIQLNDNDILVFFENVEGVWQIMYFNGSIVQQVTNGAYHSVFPQINNRNEIVWTSFDGKDYEIFFATPVFINND